MEWLCVCVMGDVEKKSLGVLLLKLQQLQGMNRKKHW